MTPSMDISLISRGALYLRAAGVDPPEAQSMALSVWSSLGDGDALADFMARIRGLAAAPAMDLKPRPLSFGHMATADFQKDPEKEG